MKEIVLQNIQLSSQIIVFDQQTHEGELTINNKHNTLGVIFKIKATKLNIIDVKPAKGFIKPQSKITINFKLSANMTLQQMETTQKNDKFLVQFLNISNQDASREQVEAIWRAYKNNTANLQQGYGCQRVFMSLTGKRLAISNIKSESNSKMYKTALKTSKTLSNDDFQKQNSIQFSKAAKKDDQELSKKFVQLKQKEQDLKQKRQNIFKHPSQPSAKGSKIKSMLVFFIVFFVAFSFGNYLRSSMVKVRSVEKVRQQKHSFIFSWLN